MTEPNGCKAAVGRPAASAQSRQKSLNRFGASDEGAQFFVERVKKPTDNKPHGTSSPPFKTWTIRGLGGNDGWGRPRKAAPVWLAMRKQDDAEPSHGPISLLSFLEAENIRLRQAIMKLSLDARAIREALKRMEAHDRVVNTPLTPRRGRRAD
jgi:hypothetical protein